MTPYISVVVPAFNEEQYLPRLLTGLVEAQRRFRRGAAAVEIIVADNGSVDDTVAVAKAHGCTVVFVEQRVIGAVRNGGARVARGEILAFVDADTQVHPETFNAIDEYFASGRRVVGVSGALPERHSLAIDLSWWLLGALTILLGYGIPRSRWDCAPTGVVCFRKADWEAISGYTEHWLFAEDVRLLLELRRLGRRRGQSSGWLKDVPAVFSTRKFDEHGDWHYLTAPARFSFLALFHRAGLARWVKRYWYGNQRQERPLTSGAPSRIAGLHSRAGK